MFFKHKDMLIRAMNMFDLRKRIRRHGTVGRSDACGSENYKALHYACVCRNAQHADRVLMR